MVSETYLETQSCMSSIFACLILSVTYVGSLYVWSSPYLRDHPSIIKKRFFSVFVMMLFSPLYLSYFITSGKLKVIPITQVLGLKLEGLIPAVLLPLFLTMVLFLGPLSMHGFWNYFKFLKEPSYGMQNLRDLIWLRNHIVAPLSEEFSFRACMMPLLLQCLSPLTAVFICPLFFGSAHLHHMLERMKCGLEFKSAFLLSCFEFCYTTMFGAYSAFLFARTGHFAAPFIAHAFCNSMGFPDFGVILTYKNPKRFIIMTLFVVGLVAWLLLLQPLTEPSLFGHNLYWDTN